MATYGLLYAVRHGAYNVVVAVPARDGGSIVARETFITWAQEAHGETITMESVRWPKPVTSLGNRPLLLAERN